MVYQGAWEKSRQTRVDRFKTYRRMLPQFAALQDPPADKAGVATKRGGSYAGLQQSRGERLERDRYKARKGWQPGKTGTFKNRRRRRFLPRPKGRGFRAVSWMIFKILMVTAIVSVMCFALWKFYQMVNKPPENGNPDITG